MADSEKRATVKKARFEEIVGALMHVPKEEADAIQEAEKKARSRKRARKAKKP
jgi:hypothetical protein